MNCLQSDIERRDRASSNNEKEYFEELVKRIQSMESKLLRGSNILDHTNEQQKALEARTAEIRERKVCMCNKNCVVQKY